MKKVILAIVSIAMFAACQPKGYNITGTIEGAEDGKVILQRIRSGRPEVVDSTELVGQKFSFKGEVKAPELYLAFYEGVQAPVAFFVDNGNISITANAEKMNEAVITGSPLTDVLVSFEKEMPGKERMTEMRQEYMQAQMSQDAAKIEDLSSEMNVIFETQIAYLDTFISKNTSNPVGALLLLNAASSLEPATFKNYALEIKSNISDHPYVTEIDTLLGQLADYEAKQEAAPEMPVPAPAEQVQEAPVVEE